MHTLGSSLYLCLLGASVALGGTVLALSLGAYWPLVILGALGWMTLTNVIARPTQAQWRRSAAFAITVVAALVALNTLGGRGHGQLVRDQATLLLALSAYPMWRFLRFSEPGLPFLPLIGLMYGLQYAAPVFSPFSQDQLYRHLPDELYSEALTLTAVGMASLYAVYYGSATWKWPHLMPRVRRLGRGWSDRPASRIAVAFGVLGLMAYMAPSVMQVPIAYHAALDFIADLSLLSIALLFYLQLQHRLNWSTRTFLWFLLVPAQVMIALSGGTVLQVARPFAVMGIIYFGRRRRIPWLQCGVLATALGLLLATKSAFRDLTWNREYGFEAKNPVTTGLKYAGAIEETGVLTGGDNTSSGVQKAVNRVDSLSIFGLVVSMTPTDVPYWGGATYVSLLWKLMPRAIFPDKPMESLGQDFGHRYSIISPDDSVTAVNLPQIVEFYANFGVLGVPIGMALLGLTYRLLHCAIEHREANEWNVVLAAVLYGSLIQIESNLSMVIGGALQWLFLLYLLDSVAFSRRSPPHMTGTKSQRGQGGLAADQIRIVSI